MRALQEATALSFLAGRDGPGANVDEFLRTASETAYDASTAGRSAPGVGVMFTAM
jgi:hypothetical protein